MGLFEGVVVGNGVGDEVVEGGGGGFGVGGVGVVERRGIAALEVEVVVVKEFVDLVGG